MYHLRSPNSTSSNPLSWCGAEPEYEVLGHSKECVIKDVVLTKDENDEDIRTIVEKPGFCRELPMLTDYEWVKPVAKGHPNICQHCVTAMENVKIGLNPDGSVKFNDSIPF